MPPSTSSRISAAMPARSVERTPVMAPGLPNTLAPLLRTGTASKTKMAEQPRPRALARDRAARLRQAAHDVTDAAGNTGHDTADRAARRRYGAAGRPAQAAHGAARRSHGRARDGPDAAQRAR